MQLKQNVSNAFFTYFTTEFKSNDTKTIIRLQKIFVKVNSL